MPRWLLDKYPYGKMTARLSMCQGDWYIMINVPRWLLCNYQCAKVTAR